MNKFKVLILLAALSLSCLGRDATNEQIAQCVNTCKTIDARMQGLKCIYRADNKMHCICGRDYLINDKADNVQETNEYK